MAQTVIGGGFLNTDLVSAQTALTTGLVSTDELIISDAGVLKRMDISVLEDYIVTNLWDNNIDDDQSTNGFAVGDVIRLTSGSNNTYEKARANTAANAEVIGIVIDVTDTNNFTYATSGEITVAAAVPNSTTAGQIVYLHTDTAGSTQTTEPSATDQISKPIAIITEANNKMVLVPFRGEIISGGATSFAPVDATYLAISANGTLTGERVLTAGTGITLTDAGAGGAATLTIDNDSITFAKMQNVAANSVLIRNANSSGDLAELALATTQILIGNGTGFTAAALSGDVTMSNAGVVTIAANAVDSTEITSGAIDLAHMSSQSVDEDNLYISNAGTNGQFLSKQSGNNGGLTWDDAGGGTLDSVIEDSILSTTAGNSAGTTGTRMIYYQLGPHPNDAPSSGGNVGFGNCFSFHFSGGSGGGSAHSTTVRGAWRLRSGNADQAKCAVYAGTANLAWNDDWTIIARFYYENPTIVNMGWVSSNPNVYRPAVTQSGGAIEIETGALATLRAKNGSGSTSASFNSGNSVSAGLHTAKIQIYNGGSNLRGVFDGETQELTANMNTGTTNGYVYFNISSWTSNTRDTHLVDFYAYREV